ncbi:MAG TPA: universal stress protein [Conexibacter sp.]|nr:universal stress protein [Conexibacter sp.]
MHRIVVGYDGSSRGADALVLARMLVELLQRGVATAPAAEIDVAVALVYPDGAIGASGQRTLDGDRRRQAEHTLEAARGVWPELPPGAFRIVQAGSPAEGLHRLAREREVDALVLGASHRSMPGRVFPGSVTEQTLQHAPCPVLVAPSGYAAGYAAGRPLRRLGVAYDGSQEARAALAEAERLAFGHDDVSVVAIDAADPVPELLDASQELDLLLLGSRGHGRFRRALLGSVSTPVVRGAACPLLLMPHGSVVVRAQAGDTPDGAAATGP